MKKPFDVLAEGLISKNNRGDKTPLEPFLAGLHSLPANLISAAKAFATIDPTPQDAYDGESHSHEGRNQHDCKR